MSLQTSRTFLLLLFLITLISCEDPNDIGLNPQNGKLLGTSFDNKQAVKAATVVHPDSILAFKNSPIAVGKVTDGDFGTISATHYSEVNLNGNNVTFNITPGAQADSLVLVLAYSGYYYGDTTQQITLNVHRLTEAFKADQTYFTNTKPTEPVSNMPLLGTITFEPRFNRVNRNGKAFSRLLRIPLSMTFANELLGKSGATEFSSQEAFKDFWKGIVITPAPGSNAGSVVSFSTIPDSAGVPLGRVAGINLHFKTQDGKPVFHNFLLSGENYYNGVEVNRAGTPLAQLDQANKSLPAEQVGNQAYIQNNTGVKTRLTFPQLASFKEQKGDVYINYAELILPVKQANPGNGVVNPAPPAIYLYESTSGNRVLKTTGGTAIPIQRGDSPANGLTRPIRVTFNADSSFYKADITSYIQAVIDGKKLNNGIIVTTAPEDRVTAVGANVPFPESSILNRAIIPTTGKQPVQLRIYYSQLK